MNLTVLDPRSPETDLTRLERDLRSRVDCELRFSRHDRLLYSTDASIYQVEPLGVAIPSTTGQVRALLSACNEMSIAVLPRGGGTSLAGQCTNHAIVVDLSALRRRVLSIDPVARAARVETGITPDDLNRQLLASQLFFAPDPATVAQATIGGCIGNNAAGSRSIKYGRTSENLLSLELVTAAGATVELCKGAGRTDPLAARLAHEVASIVLDHAQLIRDRFPKTLRRNAGYGLDLILQQLDAGTSREDLDLTGLICGSEGTLGVVTEATLQLHPIPRFKSLVLLSFDTLEESIDLTPGIVTTGCCAVELLDDVVLEAAANNNECRRYLELFPPTVTGKQPRAVLFVEYQSATSNDDVDAQVDRLRQLIGSTAFVRVDDPARQARAWALRKAGEPLLHGIPGNRKPQTFVEDNAIPIENLGIFVRQFKQILARHGTHAAYYAHASVGVLHIRPLIDLHDQSDRKAMRDIAVEVADLARACGGVMSGEHGDGRIRGPLLERYFGPELVRAFTQVKQVFDPKGILNPTMIVGAGHIDSLTQRLRTDEVGQKFDVDQINTAYDYADQHGFRGAVEMCNGAGVCRKTAGGTMCPSYRGTLDERHSTRGRGNALRLAISGQFSKSGDQPNYSDLDTLQTLDLCLSCKACKSECPSNVDIARLKAEYLHQSFQKQGTPLKARVFGHVRTFNRLGAMMPAVSNFTAKLRLSKWIANRFLGIAKQRTLPAYSTSLYKLHKTQKTGASRVVLYADCFATYNDSHIGVAAIEVLRAFGYSVELPKVGCCGRAMMSTGLLADAIASADKTLAQLKPFVEDPTVVAILVLEPSCLASFKDDWLHLKMKSPAKLRQLLASKAMLVDEFLDAKWDQHPTVPPIAHSTKPVILHGHCHQKALWGDATSSNLLKRLCGNVTVLDSGCCGMAGSFGYDEKRYDLSMKIGELSVFPPIRAASAGTLICAPGTSCRHQIRDGTSRLAKHPIEVVRDLL